MRHILRFVWRILKLHLTSNLIRAIMGPVEGTITNLIRRYFKMYVQRWVEAKLVHSFFRWVSRMRIQYELANPAAPFQHDDFEVRMHQSDWKKFEEHF